jgi:hypothetical protein
MSRCSPTSSLGDAVELGKPLDPATSIAILKSLEVRTTHRACSGSVGCLHVSHGQLSQFSEATRLCRRRPFMYVIAAQQIDR